MRRTPTGALRLCGAWLLFVLLAAPAHAQLRSPQVPVTGTALQSLFAAQGQEIDVATQQLDFTRASIAAGEAIPVEVLSSAVESGFGLYNASVAAPPLYLLHPGAATAGWFVVASFRTLPARLVVNMFDDNRNLVSTTTYLAGPPDRTDIGFYCQGPGGLAYSQDDRNPGGQPLMLAFAGTGAHAGKTWLAWESSPGPGADYADAIFLIGSTFIPVDVVKTTWGSVKQRFR